MLQRLFFVIKLICICEVSLFHLEELNDLLLIQQVSLLVLFHSPFSLLFVEDLPLLAIFFSVFWLINQWNQLDDCQQNQIWNQDAIVFLLFQKNSSLNFEFLTKCQVLKDLFLHIQDAALRQDFSFLIVCFLMPLQLFYFALFRINICNILIQIQIYFEPQLSFRQLFQALPSDYLFM